MADLQDLLIKTSRTFALSIPLLEEPTRQEVTIAYLLFRIADTFEDSASWPPEKRIAALNTFSELLEKHDTARTAALAKQWADQTPIEHEGYQELLAETADVLDAFWHLDPAARDSIRVHVQRTCEGMAGFVSQTRADSLQLDDLPQLRKYCYTVAGIVGEMLTELFVLGEPDTLGPRAAALRERAAEFGEGLQLVNILKDSGSDLEEGRSYLPKGVPRSEVFALARRDLERAAEYVSVLQQAGSKRGVISFNALPMMLAWATLDRVERDGPGSKLTRPEVFAIIEKLEAALDDNTPITPPTPA